MISKTTSNVELFTCPGCNGSVFGTAHIEVSLPDNALHDKIAVIADVNVVGVVVTHDCTTKVHR